MAAKTRRRDAFSARFLRVVLSSSLLQMAVSVGVRAADDPLARARALYNARQFEAAVNAAEQARLQPSRANAADLVAARAYLERYRDSGATDDLANARERLRRLNPGGFTPRERTEYIVGLGETLYFDGAYGAAANGLDTVLQGWEPMPDGGRGSVRDVGAS